MNLIASFQVDHTKIVPGIYESRVDEIGGDFATTFDIRMKTPNREPAIHPNAMHTIEHVVATFLRCTFVMSVRPVFIMVLYYNILLYLLYPLKLTLCQGLF